MGGLETFRHYRAYTPYLGHTFRDTHIERACDAGSSTASRHIALHSCRPLVSYGNQREWVSPDSHQGTPTLSLDNSRVLLAPERE